jgi:hypothetical protein
MDDYGTLLLLAALLAGVWIWYRTRGGGSRGAEAQLRSICLGNAQQAERLIDGEMKRAPGISRTEAARRAIERYRRDNR